MKKMKLAALLTIFCMSLFSLGAYSQIVGDPLPELQNNTLYRTPCVSGYVGCTNDAVDIRLSTAAVGSTTRTFTMNSTHTFPLNQTRIKVITAGGSSTGIYSLPTVVGDQVVIDSTDGILPYTVFIQKTAPGQFKVSVSKFSL